MGQSKRIVVVLAGAVAKGAFEAGAIRALSRADVEIVRIVGASSGALNGTVLASAVRSRDIRAGAEMLVTLWQDHAEWSDIFHASFRDIIKREGMSDAKRLMALLREHIPPSDPPDPAEINLRLIVAALHGCRGDIGKRPATTFESLRDFDSAAFATRGGLDAVFAAAIASASFPIVFAPVEVAGVGPCIDGGTVNNTPMKWALDGAIGASVDAIVVIATSVEHRTEPPEDLSGLGLVAHIADMLIEERLYRDLREAAQVNADVAALDALVARGELDAAGLGRIKGALGWTRRRVVDIVPIRPTRELRGNAFSGFFHADIRREHVDAGYLRGLEVLGGRGWSMRPAGRAAAAPDHGVVGTPGAASGVIDRDRGE